MAREKLLEDKLIKVKTMISKNIGKSQTDLIREKLILAGSSEYHLLSDYTYYETRFNISGLLC